VKSISFYNHHRFLEQLFSHLNCWYDESRKNYLIRPIEHQRIISNLMANHTSTNKKKSM
jgi:hypothetical protein